jgi:hypothetical protein
MDLGGATTLPRFLPRSDEPPASRPTMSSIVCDRASLPFQCQPPTWIQASRLEHLCRLSDPVESLRCAASFPKMRLLHDASRCSSTSLSACPKVICRSLCNRSALVHASATSVLADMEIMLALILSIQRLYFGIGRNYPGEDVICCVIFLSDFARSRQVVIFFQ